MLIQYPTQDEHNPRPPTKVVANRATRNINEIMAVNTRILARGERSSCSFGYDCTFKKRMVNLRSKSTFKLGVKGFIILKCDITSGLCHSCLI